MVKKVPIVLFVLMAAGWFLFLRPAELGGPASYVIVSGDSMLPTLEPGDLTVMMAEDSYEDGDVAVYEIPRGQPGYESGARIIHRIVGKDGSTYIAQGDNRDRVDPWTPGDAEVLGSMQLHIPNGGNVLLKVVQPPFVAAVAGGLTAFFIVTGSNSRREEAVEPA